MNNTNDTYKNENLQIKSNLGTKCRSHSLTQVLEMLPKARKQIIQVIWDIGAAFIRAFFYNSDECEVPNTELEQRIKLNVTLVSTHLVILDNAKQEKYFWDFLTRDFNHCTTFFQVNIV